MLVGGCRQPAVRNTTHLAVPADYYPIRPQPKPPVWSSTLQEGFARARREGKPVLAYFGTDWSLDCQAYTKSLFPDRSFIEAAEPFVLVRIDVDRDEKLADSYGVKGIPDIVFFDAEGGVLDRVEGYQGTDLFKRFSPVLAKFEKRRASAARAVSEPPAAPIAG